MKKILYPFSFLFLIIFFAQLLSAQQSVYSNNGVEKLAESFQFVEGPVWMNGALLFSDIPAGKIYKWTPGKGTTTFVTNSGNSNGLALDLDGNLLLAQHGPRQVSRLESDGTVTPLATHYNGKRLNSPNDLIVKSDGSIFFTDPTFGLNDQQGISELGYQGIYRISPGGEVQLLDKTLDLPNGIAFSPDESKLYANDSQKRLIYVWDVVNDSTVANKRLFASIQPTGYADGMEMNDEGIMFCSGPLGVWVYDSTGTLLDTIRVEANPSNCGWGDEDGKTLYITAGTAIYRVRPNLTDTSDVYNKP